MSDAVRVTIVKREKQPSWGSSVYNLVLGTTPEFDNEPESLLSIDERIEFIAQKVKEKMIIVLSEDGCKITTEEDYLEPIIDGNPCFDDRGNIIGAKIYDSPAILDNPEGDLPPVEIPKDLDEAIKFLTNDQNIKFAKGSEDDHGFMCGLHHGFGTGIRNTWGLWSGSDLQRWFKNKGIHHADDMSGIILTSFYRSVMDEPINLESQIKKYRKFWDEHDPNVNTGNFGN